MADGRHFEIVFFSLYLSRGSSDFNSGVYPYLQMAQLSHGQFWGERKNTRIRTHLKHILNVITLKYDSKYPITEFDA